MNKILVLLIFCGTLLIGAEEPGGFFNFEYTLKYDNSPYSETAEWMFKQPMRYSDIDSYWDYFDMNNHSPAILNRLRLYHNDEFSAGIMYSSSKGEKSLFACNAADIVEDGKYYIEFTKIFRDDIFSKILMGNYRVSFGKGLVMDNTELFVPRKLEQEENVSMISPDQTSGQEYNLQGGALEFRSGNFLGTVYISRCHKDAVVYDSNQDGVIDEDDNEVFGYISMSHRFENSELMEAESGSNIKMAPRRDWLQEDIIGGHIAWIPYEGSSLGLSGYEAVYDKELVINSYSLEKYLWQNDEDAWEKWSDADSEIMAAYSTSTEQYNRNYRRIYGIDWQMQAGITHFAGEFAVMQKDGKELSPANDPQAVLITSMSQWEKLHFFILYRDYDLEYDNPYSRGFSENHRFNGTILDEYANYTTNNLLNDLAVNSIQPQAEKGIYFESSYVFCRKLSLPKVSIDMWKRNSDLRRSLRFAGEIKYFISDQIALMFQHKYLQNGYDDYTAGAKSTLNETEGQITVEITSFDKMFVEYLYLSSKGEIFTNSFLPASSICSADNIQIGYIHEFTWGMNAKTSFMIWGSDGFCDMDWDNVNIDIPGREGFKFNLILKDSLFDNLNLILNYSYRQYNPWEFSCGDSDELKSKNSKDNAFILQLDYNF